MGSRNVGGRRGFAIGKVKVTALKPEHSDFVWNLLVYAAHEPNLESVKSQEALHKYASDWGKEGDMGVLAQVDKTQAGAAWLRLWQDEEKGYGYIEEGIPELTIAVLPEYRNMGLGKKLLSSLIEMARERDMPGISLTCRTENPAMSLYTRVGFATEELVPTRVGSGMSAKMIIRFS